MPPTGEGQAYFQEIVTKEHVATVLELALKNMAVANTSRGGIQVAMHTPLQKSSPYPLILLSTGNLILATNLEK